MFSQVCGRKWRLDGLLIVRDLCVNVEVDGRGHDPRGDEGRQRAWGMVTLRIRGDELLRGPSLADRLRALGC